MVGRHKVDSGLAGVNEADHNVERFAFCVIQSKGFFVDAIKCSWQIQT